MGFEDVFSFFPFQGLIFRFQTLNLGGLYSFFWSFPEATLTILMLLALIAIVVSTIMARESVGGLKS